MFGDDYKALFNDGSVFTIDELIERVPTTIMVGVTQVVPPVKMQDAVKASEMKKAS